MSSMRAAPCALLVRIGSCQPCQERALMPMPSSVMARRPDVTCSPEATTASYSRASCSGAAARHQRHQLVGLAGHRRHHDGDLVAGIDLALDVVRHIADAVDVGDRRSAEFHHQTGHLKRSVLELLTPPRSGWRAGPKRRVYIPMGSGGCNRSPLLTKRAWKWPGIRSARAPSTRPRWSGFPRSPPNGGTRAARWPRCTSSIRCASAISATRPPRASTATPSGSTR